jgi:hypothetical protein
VFGSAQLVVDGCDVEGELAEVLGFAGADFELEDDETAQAEMEEDQVGEELSLADV